MSLPRIAIACSLAGVAAAADDARRPAIDGATQVYPAGVIATIEGRWCFAHHHEASAFAGDGRARAVVLGSGDVITADACIAATGVKPNIDYVDGGGFSVGWGVQVDDRLHTGVADVWAAGDCAETRDRMTGERFVHAIFPNAINQGRVVAEQLMGFETLYEGAETMNSLRHLGVPVMAVGELTGDAEAVRSTSDSLRRIVLRDGCIVGFRLAGEIRGAGVYRSLMLRGIDVGAYGEGLADPAFIDRRLACPFVQLAA